MRPCMVYLGFRKIDFNFRVGLQKYVIVAELWHDVSKWYDGHWEGQGYPKGLDFSDWFFIFKFTLKYLITFLEFYLICLGKLSF